MKKKLLILLMAVTIVGTSIPAAAATTEKTAVTISKTSAYDDNVYYNAYGTIGYGYTTRGEGVRELQHLLNWMNLNSGAEDGIFGTNTYQALRRFQTRYAKSVNPLVVDGICGPATWSRLLNCYQI